MKFSYDPQTDTAYQAYAAQLAAQSDTEKKNTLGLLAKRTGGLPSSYAVGAVKAVGDNYAAKAAQAQQTYRQAALDVFNENYNQRNTLLKTLLSLREAEEDAYYKQLEAETARLKQQQRPHHRVHKRQQPDGGGQSEVPPGPVGKKLRLRQGAGSHPAQQGFRRVQGLGRELYQPAVQRRQADKGGTHRAVECH